jgi:hypothetical protein
MDEQFTQKSELLDKIAMEWTLLQSTIAGWSAEQKIAPVLEGGWSAKDTLAHIRAWEQEMIAWFEALQHGERPDRPPFGLSNEAVDQMNEAFYRENQARPLAQVQAESRRSHEQVLQTVQSATDVDLFDAKRFQWLEGNAFWPIVAANTCWHYQEHREALESWIKASGFSA